MTTTWCELEINERNSRDAFDKESLIAKLRAKVNRMSMESEQNDIVYFAPRKHFMQITIYTTFGQATRLALYSRLKLEPLVEFDTNEIDTSIALIIR